MSRTCIRVKFSVPRTFSLLISLWHDCFSLSVSRCRVSQPADWDQHMALLCGALGDSEFYRVCPFQDLKREVLPQGPFLSALPVCTAGHLLPVMCVSELGLALGTLRPQVELNTGDFPDWHILALGCVASRRSILAEIGHSL